MAITDYVKLVSEESGIEEDICRSRMELARDRYGINFPAFYRKQLINVHESYLSAIGKSLAGEKERRVSRYASLASKGLDEQAVKALISDLNEMGIVKVTLQIVERYELYRYKGETLRARLSRIGERQALETCIAEHFTAIDAGLETWEEVQPDLEKHCILVRSLMTDTIAAPFEEAFAAYDPDIKTNVDYRNAVISDMEMCRLLLKCNTTEYIMFHLFEKDWRERREFLMTTEYLPILRQLNSREYENVLSDKMKAYNLLKPLYGREAIAVRGADDLEKYRAFCEGKPAVVLKPVGGAMGSGIRKVDLSDIQSREAIPEELLTGGSYIVEELIRPHRKIRKLNPDSVNTVRVVTCCDGANVWIQKCFMKVGRSGSFVDNGGAGGIFVSVDQETGRFNSGGCDENGIRYETHPDHGFRFMGYRLPNWQAAIELAKKAAPLVAGFRYIGWDLTCTEDGRWIVVEGNSRTQFLGQQSTADRGMRKEFMEMVSRLGF